MVIKMVTKMVIKMFTKITILGNVCFHNVYICDLLLCCPLPSGTMLWVWDFLPFAIWVYTLG